MFCSHGEKQDGTDPDRVPLIPEERHCTCGDPEEHKGRCACCDSQPDFNLMIEIGISRKAHALHPRRLHEAVKGNT